MSNIVACYLWLIYMSAVHPNTATPLLGITFCVVAMASFIIDFWRADNAGAH